MLCSLLFKVKLLYRYLANVCQIFANYQLANSSSRLLWEKSIPIPPRRLTLYTFACTSMKRSQLLLRTPRPCHLDRISETYLWLRFYYNLTSYGTSTGFAMPVWQQDAKAIARLHGTQVEAIAWHHGTKIEAWTKVESVSVLLNSRKRFLVSATRPFLTHKRRLQERPNICQDLIWWCLPIYCYFQSIHTDPILYYSHRTRS